jgi:hypothetical protein
MAFLGVHVGLGGEQRFHPREITSCGCIDKVVLRRVRRCSGQKTDHNQQRQGMNKLRQRIHLDTPRIIDSLSSLRFYGNGLTSRLPLLRRRPGQYSMSFQRSVSRPMLISGSGPWRRSRMCERPGRDLRHSGCATMRGRSGQRRVAFRCPRRSFFFHSLLHIHRVSRILSCYFHKLHMIEPDQKSGLSAVGTSEFFPA